MFSDSILILTTIFTVLFHNTQAQVFETDLPTSLPENTLLTEQHIRERETKRYMLQVSDQYYQAGQHLTITGFATSFNSDPDLYISQSIWANTQGLADWYCTRAGSDTCIIPASNIQVGNYYYIVVVCLEECTYDIKSYYATEYTLAQNEQTAYRWGGTSTNIFKYHVPKQTASGAQTGRWTIEIDPEYQFEQFQVYLSIDSHFNLIEEKQEAMIFDDAVIIQQTDKSANWCVDCDVYVILVTVGDRRVYIKTEAVNFNLEIGTTVPIKGSILRNQFECYSYTIQSESKDKDVVFQLVNFQGHLEALLTANQQATSFKSSSIKLASKKQSPIHTILARNVDRTNWNQKSGNYFICGFAYTASSLKIKASESNMNNQLNVENNQLVSFWMYNYDFLNFELTTGQLKSNNLEINIDLNYYLTSGSVHPYVTELLYQLCTSNNCDKSINSQQFKQSNKQKNVGIQGEIPNTYSYRFSFLHNSTLCSGTEQCYYVFQVFNPDKNTTPLQVDFKLWYESHDYTKISVTGEVVGELGMENKKKYKIPLEGNYFNYLDSLKIELMSTFGDVDLVVKADNKTFSSLSQLKYDQVVLDRQKIPFTSDIQIEITARMLSYFSLKVYPTYIPTVDSRLTKAIPLVERKGQRISMNLANDEVLLSYQPWFSAHEQMTICFLSDNMFNNIYFYAEIDQYPLNYVTNLFDTNGILTIQSDNPKYFISQGVFGTYYVRVRPQYKFANLIEDEKYALNFYAFAQPKEGDFSDLYTNQTLMGVANSTQMPTQYRHLLIAANQTVVITLTGIYGKGFPELLVKLSNVQTQVYGLNLIDYDISKKLDSNNQFVTIRLNSAFRQSINPLCEQAGYNNGTAGNINCGIYMGVKCGEDEQLCAYKISLTAYEDEEGTQAVQYNPSYITWNKDYVNGAVAAGKTRYYYLPIDQNTIGNVAILLNKTTPYGGGNGDVNLQMVIHPGAGLRWYKRWIQPLPARAHAFSQNNQNNQPEVIEICQEAIQSWCNYNSYPECSIMLRVDGVSQNETGFFRLKAFNGTNYVAPGKPTRGEITNKGDFVYYWFVASAPTRSTREWAFEISLGIESINGDADLYVSVMDGRYPTESDFDYYSDMIGTDHVTIKSTDHIFAQQPGDPGWNDEVGVMIVIGVIAYTEEVNYSLTIKGPYNPQFNTTDLTTSKPNTFDIPYDQTRSDKNPLILVYRWFNWFSNDFALAVTQFSGGASYYLNVVSEETTLQNIFTATGVGAGNAIWASTPPLGTVDQFTSYIGEDAYPAFCYNCWYYLTVVISDQSRTQYKVQFNQITNNGTALPVLQNNQQFQIRSTVAETRKWTKFLLASKDPFQIKLMVAEGTVGLQVVLDPKTTSQVIWQLESVSTGTHYINVTSGDPNFHFGTYYYVSVRQIGQGTSSVAVSYKQDKTVQILPNGITQKYTFGVSYRQVMFFMLQVPVSLSFTHKVQLNFTSIDDFGYFYPGVYLTKYQASQAVNPDQVKDLPFATIQDHSLKFGSNHNNAKSNTVSKTLSISWFQNVYDFEGSCSQSFCYYLITVYQNTYGLTDLRKPQFEFTATAWETNINSPQVLLMSSGEDNLIQ